MHPAAVFSLIVEGFDYTGPTAVDNIIDCILKLTGVES